jgi:hypothetical protein
MGESDAERESRELRVGKFSVFADDYDEGNQQQSQEYNKLRKRFSSVARIKEERQSPIDSANKRSEGYRICFGVIFVGISSKSKKPISFLLHANPHWRFENDFKESESRKKFEDSLRATLKDFLALVVPKTFGAVFFGGRVKEPGYENAKECVTHIVSQLSKTELVVVPTGPVVVAGRSTDAWVDTEGKKIHILRDSPG